MNQTYAELLTSDEVQQVHAASLEILHSVGILVRNAEARERLAFHGCRVDSETQVVRFPPAVVEGFRQSVPATFTLHGRDPAHDRTVPGDGPLMATASSAPDVVDPQTGLVRRSTSADIARIAYLVNEMAGYDLFGICTTADDAPAGQFSLTRFYATLKNCVKPVRGSAPSLAEAAQIVEMGAEIAGGPAAFWERPFVTFQYCPMVSPLTMDVESTEKLMRFTELGIPSYGIPAPNAGITAPLTLVGLVAQSNAEFLAQTVLEQICRPGKAVVYDMLPTVADMRTAAYAPGGIETGMMSMAFAQMARFYRVPSASFVGLTNAKVNDAQSGFETGMSTVAALLGGTDVLTMGGLLDALMAFDYAKLAIDDEIAQMLKRIARGMECSRENLAVEVVAQVGPGSTFLDNRHTRRRMRTMAFLPEIADRESREQWQAHGGLDAQARAMRRVDQILSRDNPAAFSADVDARIRSRFADLVAGTAEPFATQDLTERKSRNP